MTTRLEYATPAQDRAADAPRPAWRPWAVCVLLFLATVVNYLDRQTLSVSASHIADEMHLSDKHLGYLFFGFLFAYGLAQIFVGPLLDRLNVRLAFAIAVVAWSLSGAAAALSTGFWSLFALRVLLGVCESPNWPSALRTVRRTIRPEHRSLANGIFQSGTSIGAVVAPPVIIYLTNLHNWRFAFIAVGLVGIAWAVLWLVWFAALPEPRLAPDTTQAIRPEYAATPSTLGEILRSRALWGLVIATCFLNPLQYLYTAWLPRYFEKYAGVGFGKELGQRLVIVYLALDIGLWSGGAVVALLSRHFSVTTARKAVTATGALLMAAIPAVSHLRSVNHITAVICCATFGLGCFMVNYLAFTAEVSAKRVSTAAGILGGAGSLAGSLFMIVVGNTVTSSGGFAVTFLLAGLMPLVALAGIQIATSRQSETA